MKYSVEITIPSSSKILLELDDTYSPNTVRNLIEKLPFTVNLNVWGGMKFTLQNHQYPNPKKMPSLLSN